MTEKLENKLGIIREVARSLEGLSDSPTDIIKAMATYSLAEAYTKEANSELSKAYGSAAKMYAKLFDVYGSNALRKYCETNKHGGK